MARHYEGEVITGADGMDYEVTDAGGGFTGWDAAAAAAGGAAVGNSFYQNARLNQLEKPVADILENGLKEGADQGLATRAEGLKQVVDEAANKAKGEKLVARSWYNPKKYAEGNWWNRQAQRFNPARLWSVEARANAEAALNARHLRADLGSASELFHEAQALQHLPSGKANPELVASKLAAAEEAIEKGARRHAARVAKLENGLISGGGKLKVIGATIGGIALGGAALGLGHNMLMGGREEKRQVLGPHTERVMAQEARQQQAAMMDQGFSPA